jgi:hypothetical protein
MTSATEFFQRFVCRAAAQWESAKLDELHALTLSVVLAHTADYYFNSLKLGDPRLLGASCDGQFRKALAIDYHPYSLMRDVADAHKHASLGRKSAAIQSPSQVSVGQRRTDEDIFFDDFQHPEEIVVTTTAGKQFAFESIAIAVFQFWKDKLA